MTSQVTVSGPIFDPAFPGQVKFEITQGIQDLTAEGEHRLQAIAPVGPTDQFQKSIHGKLRDSEHGVIAPETNPRNGEKYFTNAMLGFWLETGKRKGESTRYKGVHLFRRVRAQLAYKAKKTAETIALRIVIKGNR